MTNNPTYSQLADIPYSHELVSLIYPEYYNKINRVLGAFKFDKLIDLLGVTENDIQQIRGIGVDKIAYFCQLQEYIKDESNWAYIVEAYDCCIKEHLFPENLSEEQQLLPLEDKINLAVSQYADYIVKLSQWHNRLEKDSKRIELIFLEKRTKAEIAKELKRTTERVRQLKIKYVTDFYEGTIKHCSHLKFSDELKAEIKDFIDSMPQYCSSARLCELLSCDNCEDCMAIAFLPIKQTPLDASGVGKNPYTYLDQLYFIPRNEDMKNLQIYVDSIYKALEGDKALAEIRPIALDGIMNLLAEIEPDFDFDREAVQELLEQHHWIETLEVDGEIRYQLAYKYLKKDYACVGRLVYEHKRVDINEIDHLHRAKLADDNAASIKNAISVARRRFPYLVTTGQNGVLEYNESGQGKPTMISAVAAYAAQHPLFAFEDLRQHLEGNGYDCTRENSIRTYILKHCSPSNQDSNLFCRYDVLSDYPQYTWRNKVQNGVGNWVIKAVRQCLLETANRMMLLKPLTTKVKALAQDEGYNIIDVWRYIYRYMSNDDIFNARPNGKDTDIILTDKGLNISADELDAISVRNRKPAYYDAVVSKIVTLLKDATDCRMRLVDLRNACESDMEGVCRNQFYKIVDNELPEQIEKIEIEGDKYLQFKQEKVVYEQSMTIAAAPQDDSTVMEPVYVEQTVEKQERSFGQVIYMDWGLLLQNLQHELSFYSRFWDLKIDMPTAINKFVDYVQQLPNSRISQNIPRKLLVLWNYRSDVYDRKDLLNEIALCYEELLRQIHFSNTKEVINANGLYETSSMIPEVYAWKTAAIDTNYHKYFRYITKLRNTIAHGGENNYSTVELLQRITEYTALYVYTVARFLKQN